jgi:hypothetical protein
MKIIGAALATAALWPPLCAAGSAQADAAQAAYVHELQQAGIPGTSDQILANGYVMCEALNSHQDVQTVASLSAPHAGLTMNQAAYEVGAAIRWLCSADQTWQIQELHDADQTLSWVTAAIAGYAGR